MRMIICCLFIFFYAPVIFSQTLRKPVSAVYLGLSAYSTQHTDVFSFVNNQAALAEVQHTSVGVYSERRFLLAETSVYTTAAAFATSKGNFGVSLQYSGFVNYNEDEFGLAYGRNLEIGAIAHLTDKLNAGIHIYNPVGGNFSKGNEKLTSTYNAGFGYDVSDIFFVSAEIVKEENFPAGLNGGVQYQFQKRFFARMGIASATSSFYAGAGVAWSNLRLDASCSVHPQLGLSPGLLLIINFDERK